MKKRMSIVTHFQNFNGDTTQSGLKKGLVPRGPVEQQGHKVTSIGNQRSHWKHKLIISRQPKICAGVSQYITGSSKQVIQSIVITTIRS